MLEVNTSANLLGYEGRVQTRPFFPGGELLASLWSFCSAVERDRLVAEFQREWNDLALRLPPQQ
ncbi:hypothetical protein MASSI9I_80046 [Massilia sp. 9I]|nr:hypothetical protein MASSI9I_80046 [Massilia sp. 9I]